MNNAYYEDVTCLYHHGVKGMHWYDRKYQYEDGSLTPLGRIHYGVGKLKKKIPTVVVVKNRPKKEAVTGDADNLTQKPSTISPHKMAEHLEKVSGVHIKEHEIKDIPQKKDPLTDEEKKELIRSGDPKRLLENYAELDRQELQDAIQRIRDADTISQLDTARRERESANAEKPNKEADDKEKESILRSGNVERILANQDKFTRNELNDAILRSADLKKLNAAVAQERKENSKIYKLVNFATKTIDTIDKYKGTYEKVKKWFDNNNDETEVYSMSPEDLLSNLGGLTKNKLAIAADRIQKFRNVTDNLSSIGIERPKQSSIDGKSIPELLAMATDSNTNMSTLKEISTKFGFLGQISESTSKMSNTNIQAYPVISNLVNALKNQQPKKKEEEPKKEESKKEESKKEESKKEESKKEEPKKEEPKKEEPKKEEPKKEEPKKKSGKTGMDKAVVNADDTLDDWRDWMGSDAPKQLKSGKKKKGSDNGSSSSADVLGDWRDWEKEKVPKQKKKDRKPADEDELDRVVEVVKGDTFSRPSRPSEEERGRQVVEALVDTMDDDDMEYVYDWIDG